MVQLALAARVLPQSLVCPNSTFVEMMEVTFNVTLPVLVSVTVCAAVVVPTVCVPNVNEVEDRVGTAPIPMPVRAMVWGLAGALSVIVIEPGRVFAATGWKVMVNVQLAPTLR